MTDANGTRNIRNGNQSPGSANSNGSPPGSLQGEHALPSASGTPRNSRITIERPKLERPKLSIPSSQYLPAPTASKNNSSAPTSSKPASSTDRDKADSAKAAANGKTSNGKSFDGKSGAAKVGERVKSRYRTTSGAASGATSEKSTRRRRSQPRSGSGERRRLFGTVPDRIKRKSSSRTRALKAKTAVPSARVSARDTGGKVTPLTKKTTVKSAAVPADKHRPALPNATYPGKVPPSRGLVRKRRRANKKYTAFRRVLQLLIVGTSLAVISGTLLQSLSETPEPTPPEIVVAPTPPVKTFPVALTQEIPVLKSSLQELPNLYPNLTPKVFYIDVDTGQYASVEGTETVAAASTIKLPILLAFFEEIDAGRIDLNRTLAIQPEHIAEGSGEMQLSPPGTQFTALEVATQMIISSDNTATNMMIELLGGNEALNSWFRQQGLEKTLLNAPLPDLAGTNTTSARDLVHTMLLISQGEALSMRSRDRTLNILNRTFNKSLLANGPMEQGALTYNKTGDIGSVLGDVSLIDLPNGKRYAIAALVERPTNDGRAQELIRRISSQAYQESAKAIQPAVTPLGSSGEASDGAIETSPTPEAAPEATPEATAVPNREPATPEEAPYPSANPRN